MKFLSFLLCVAAMMLMPLQGQTKRAASTGEPASGVRFVVCSPAGIEFPSRLYVRNGQEFSPINIGSRTPSHRVVPVGGKVDFWKQNPNPDAGKKGKKGPAVKIPKADFSVSVPGNSGEKHICILTPKEDISQTSSIFLLESNFPRKGMHVVNLSTSQIEILTSTDISFKEPKKYKPLEIYRNSKGLTKDNWWSFTGKAGQQISFMLKYKARDSKTAKQLKASAFVIADKQSIINLVVDDPKTKRPKLITIQVL